MIEFTNMTINLNFIFSLTHNFYKLYTICEMKK